MNLIRKIINLYVFTKIHIAYSISFVQKSYGIIEEDVMIFFFKTGYP